LRPSTQVPDRPLFVALCRALTVVTTEQITGDSQNAGVLRNPGNLVRLRTVRPFDDVKSDGIAFFQTFVSIKLDGAEVDEYVISSLVSEETVPFCIVEPFDRSLKLWHVASFAFEGICIGIPTSVNSVTYAVIKEEEKAAGRFSYINVISLD
jgi:hypothetical protein